MVWVMWRPEGSATGPSRIARAACRSERRSAAPSAPRWTGTCDVLDLRRVASPAWPSPASSRAPARDVLVVDRYEIGERQTSACAAPTEWLDEPRPRRRRSARRSRELVVHTPMRRRPLARCRGRSRRSTTASCARCCAAQGDAAFETAKVDGSRARHGPHRPHRPRRPARAAGRRRARLAARAARARPSRSSRPRRASRAAWRSTRAATRRRTSSCGSTRSTSAPATLGFPAGDELRVGVGSFDPRDHVKEPTVRARRRPRRRPPSATRATGSRTSCAPAIEDGVFFAGDTAGHCLPTTAEGIRTALFFGLACGRELRAVVEGRQTREQALARYAAFCEDHALRVRLAAARPDARPPRQPARRS